jgi:hypothetical protein
VVETADMPASGTHGGRFEMTIDRTGAAAAALIEPI